MKKDTIKMLTLFLIIIFFAVSFSGCVEEPTQNNDPPTIDDYIIKTSDLPDGFVIATIDRNQSNQIGFSSEIEALEILGLTFDYDSETNLSGAPFIAVTIATYISHKAAKDAISFSEFVMGSTIVQLFNDSGEIMNTTMADSSMGRYFNGPLNETYQFENASWTYLFARINKTNFFISMHKINPDPDYPYQQQTIDLMELMLTRYRDLN